MFVDHETYVPGKSADVKLKPSQAMRIGAALRPQCVGRPFNDGKSCALGAMYEGFGGKRTDGNYKIYGFVNRLLGSELVSQVYIRNDNHNWTREQIADWLEAQGL